MKKFTWAINVYNRAVSLRVQEKMIRQEFGDLVDIVVVSNCPKEDIWKVTNCEEDRFVWQKNSGHCNGARDLYESVCGQLGNSVVVSTLAKTWLTDYSSIRSFIERVQDDEDSFLFLENEKNKKRFALDFFITNSIMYTNIFSSSKLSQDFDKTSEGGPDLANTVSDFVFDYNNDYDVYSIVKGIKCEYPETDEHGNFDVKKAVFKNINNDSKSNIISTYYFSEAVDYYPEIVRRQLQSLINEESSFIDPKNSPIVRSKR